MEKVDIFKNCPTSRWDKELSFGVSYIPSYETNLPCDIIVDTSGVYRHYNHPLCLFVVDGENVIPVTIEEIPKAKGSYDIPISLSLFIVDNLEHLVSTANPMADTGDLYDAIENYAKI
jgi:hypothetical protein